MTSRPRLLIVDDEVGIRKMMRRWTEREGFELIEAATSREGFVAATTEQPDLILLDYMLPDGTGASVLKLLKDDPRTKDIPVVCWSGREPVEHVQGLLQTGALAFFHKTEIGEAFKGLVELLRQKS